jgi:hypothetical protein
MSETTQMKDFLQFFGYKSPRRPYLLHSTALLCTFHYLPNRHTPQELKGMCKPLSMSDLYLTAKELALIACMCPGSYLPIINCSDLFSCPILQYAFEEIIPLNENKPSMIRFLPNKFLS